jgi:small-conductance mechanosensitive channel
MSIEFNIDLLYQVLTVVLILIATYILGKIIARFLREAFKKAGISETETMLLASIVKYSTYLIGTSIALGYIGIPIYSIWIALAFGVAVFGIAARSALSNIISGYFLRTYGPLEVGDVIEIGGRIGMVKDVTPLKIVLETAEHFTYLIPNSQAIKLEIYNLMRYKSGYPVELEFEISQEADLKNVRLKMLEIISAYPKVSFEKPVRLHIKQFTGEGIWLKVLFFVPNFEISLGAKDFVSSEILKKSKAGEILLQSSNKRFQDNSPQNPGDVKPMSLRKNQRKEDETTKRSIEEPKCSACDSHNWHGFLHCEVCGSYFIFGKCEECDQQRLEKCPIDGGELEFIDSKQAET